MLHLRRGAGGAERGGRPLHLLWWWWCLWLLLCLCLYLSEEFFLDAERFKGDLEAEISSLQAWELQKQIVALGGRACIQILVQVFIQVQTRIRV